MIYAEILRIQRLYISIANNLRREGKKLEYITY